MRKILLALLLLAVAPAAYAEDCGNATNQTAMTECFGKSFEKADAELNKVYRDVTGRLKGDAAKVKLLVSAEKAWLGFRDGECEFRTSGAEGGTIRPTLVYQCREDLTRKRIEELKFYLKCGEGDLSCPVPPK